MIKQLLIWIFMTIVKTIVSIYTVITLPIYYLMQKPWETLQKANCVRSRQIDPSSPSSEWIRDEKRPYHILSECATITEGFQKISTLYPPEQPALGYREVIEEEVQYDAQGNAIRVDGKILRKYKLSDYKWMTLSEVQTKIDDVAKGLLSCQIKKGDKIAIFADTCASLFICFLAIDRMGGIVVTVFTTLDDDGIVHAFNQTKLTVCITSYEYLWRLTTIASKLQTLTTVIYFEGPHPVDAEKVMPNFKLIPLSQLENNGRIHKQLKFDPLGPDEISMIMYTSGTTGVPKGVMATQRQSKEAGLAMLAIVKDVMEDGPRHTYVAYLPMAHILEASVQLFLFAGGVKIGYATPFTLNESAPGLANGEICDLKLLKPTIMTCVPLVLDRIRKEMYTKLRSRTPVSVDIFQYLTSYKIYWLSKGYNTPIVNKLLCGKVREQLGNKLEFLVVGGAPLSPELHALIKSAVNITLVQGYGATETLGAVLCMDFDDLSYGRIGAPLSGIRVKFIDWEEGGYKFTDKPNPRGEIVIGGDKVSSGYYCVDDSNRNAFYIENDIRWFNTGDIAECFPDGTFKIIDRKSDLIKLQNGEFISLGKIEAALKNCDYVDNICVCGNSTQDFTIALVVPNQLSLMNLAKLKSLQNLSFDELCKNELITKMVFDAIVHDGNNMKLNRRETPFLITLVPEVWSPDNEFLTAAMKLKRRNIHKYYEDLINQMFIDATIVFDQKKITNKTPKPKYK